MHTLFDKKLLMLKPCDIKIPSYMSLDNSDTYSLYSLAQSIKTIGLINPIAVRKSESGKYILISGKRRLLSAKLAGLRRIACIVLSVPHSEAEIIAIAENLQRKEIDIFSTAEKIKSAIQKHKIPMSEMALKLGTDQNTLLEKLRLLRLDSRIRSRLTDYSLTESHARSLLRLPPEKRTEALEWIIKNNLDSMQTELYINELLDTKPQDKKEPKIAPVRKSAISDLRLFSNSLTKLTETLNSSGFDAYVKRSETERYIEYKVRIKKEEKQKITAEQLKIC